MNGIELRYDRQEQKKGTLRFLFYFIFNDQLHEGFQSRQPPVEQNIQNDPGADLLPYFDE